MKLYIKDGKIYKTPIKIKDGEKIIISNNDEVIKSYGYFDYVPVKPQPTMEQLIEESVERLNKECDEKILNEFFWNGNEFYLSMENQFNFKNLYDLRNMKEYPVTIKTKTGFTTLNSPEEVEDFYLSGVMFIEKCLHICWEEKIAAEEEIRKKYEN